VQLTAQLAVIKYPPASLSSQNRRRKSIWGKPAVTWLLAVLVSAGETLAVGR